MQKLPGENPTLFGQVFPFRIGRFTVMKEVLAQILDRVFNFRHGYAFLFQIAKQTNPNQSNRRSLVQ